MIPLLTAAASLVPSLARWIGGDKAGDLADKVAGVVTTLTGNPYPLAGLDAIKADPALLSQFQRDVMNIELEFYRAEIDDRKDARRREVDMAAHGDNTARTLAFVVVGAFVASTLGLIGAAVFGATGLKDATIAGFVGGALGYLSAKAEQVISYYFGSSRSSQSKDATIQHIARMP